jgi:IclR family transcriptional regulator, KDG regulon repressor
MTAQIDVVPEEFAGRRGDAANDSSGTASVTKALRLLDVFRSDGPVLGVSELARQAGVAKSTAFRLLALLEDAELVERDGRGYRLSWRLFELGTSVQRRWPSGLREIAAPWLTEVFVRAGGNVVHLAVLDGTDVLYLDKVSSPRSPRVPTAVGSRVPATVTALGKAILASSPSPVVREVVEAGMPRLTAYSITESGRMVAELQRIRQSGVAIDREESTLGLTCVAAPIITGAHTIAAVSVSGPTSNFDVNAHSRLVRWAARRIAIDLGADAAASTAGL